MKFNMATGIATVFSWLPLHMLPKKSKIAIRVLQ